MQVVLIEDNVLDAILMRELLAELNFSGLVLHHCKTLGEGIRHVQAVQADACLLDLGLPDSMGLATFLTLHEACPDVAVVVLTGMDTPGEIALQALQLGAQDFLPKAQLSASVLGRALLYAIERSRLSLELVRRRFLPELRELLTDVDAYLSRCEGDAADAAGLQARVRAALQSADRQAMRLR